MKDCVAEHSHHVGEASSKPSTRNAGAAPLVRGGAGQDAVAVTSCYLRGTLGFGPFSFLRILPGHLACGPCAVQEHHPQPMVRVRDFFGHRGKLRAAACPQHVTCLLAVSILQHDDGFICLRLLTQEAAGMYFFFCRHDLAWPHCSWRILQQATSGQYPHVQYPHVPRHSALKDLMNIQSFRRLHPKESGCPVMYAPTGTRKLPRVREGDGPCLQPPETSSQMLPRIGIESQLSLSGEGIHWADQAEIGRSNQRVVCRLRCSLMLWPAVARGPLYPPLA